MSKNKSVFITAVMALMLTAILVGLYQINIQGFKALAAALGLYGFLSAAADLCKWLQAEPEPEKKPGHLMQIEGDPFVYDDEDDGAKLFDRIRFESVKGE